MGFEPQLEGDIGKAGVSLGYRSDQLLPFVFGHVPHMRTSVPMVAGVLPGADHGTYWF